jgi:hypothetical protein
MSQPRRPAQPARPADDRAGLSPFEVATEVRVDATTHLTALAGDASMCAIGRSGRSFPAAKYHEGRQAAAGQARRVLRGSPASTTSSAGSDGLASGGKGADDSVAEALAGVTSEWRRMLTDAEAKGPDWVAYATGGLDALAEISEPTG